MPEEATSGPVVGLVDITLAGTELNSPEGYDIRGIRLNHGLELAVQLLSLLDIEGGIDLVQKGIDLFVAIVR